MSKIITLNVYLQDNCFKFCINGKYVEFENIINTLKNISILNDKEDCTLKNPLYTFKIKVDGNSASGLTLELLLTMVKNETISTEQKDSIEIKVFSNYFVINDKEIRCSDIIALLLKLTNDLIGTVERRETLENLFSKNSTQSLKVN